MRGLHPTAQKRSVPTCWALIGAVVALVAGCGSTGDDSAGGPGVSTVTIVATTNILGDIAQEVVGDVTEVEVLMAPNADPHSFGVSAQQAASMQQADLLIANGLGLEEGLVTHLDSARDSGVPIFEAGDAVQVMDFSDADTGVTLSDPHWWTNPTQTLRVIDALAGALGAVLPGHQDEFDANATRYSEQVVELHEWMQGQFDRLPPENRALITNHHVFGYMAAEYHFDVIGAIIPSGTSLASPSAADLQSLSQALEEAGVNAIFVDSSHSSQLAEVLAAETGRDVEVVTLFTESLSNPGEGAQTYVEMMTTNTERVVEALR